MQSKNAYVIMPLGKRNDKSMWDKKMKALGGATPWAFFLFNYSGQETTRLVLPYLLPSSHLQT